MIPLLATRYEDIILPLRLRFPMQQLQYLFGNILRRKDFSIISSHFLLDPYSPNRAARPSGLNVDITAEALEHNEWRQPP
jgi:hypothetical protein